MEINAKTVPAHSPAKRPDAEAKAAQPDGAFAQIFRNVGKPATTHPIVPAPATLTHIAPTRSSFFMQNMPIELRRSAVEDEHFRPQAAALEPLKGAGGRVLAQHAVSGN
jgi:hypothetical protein